MPETDRPRPLVPVLLAWLVPGAGHVKIGRPWPALFVVLGVIPLFLLGMVLAGYENVSPERHPWYFGLQLPAGLPTAFAWLLTENAELSEVPPHLSIGRLYTAVAGLLNLIALTDVWARCRRGDPESLAAGAADLASSPGEGVSNTNG